MEKILLSVDEAAEQICMCPKSVREMVNRREIPSVRVGRRVLIRRSDLITWADNLETV